MSAITAARRAKVEALGGEKRHLARVLSVEQIDDLYQEAWGIHEDNEKHRREHTDARTFYNAVLTLGRGFGKLDSIADMSCGTGYVARTLARESSIEPMLGDLGKGYPYVGPLSETVPTLPRVDLFVCTETIEHLPSPDADLKTIREHCFGLLLTTPVDEPEPQADGHLWVWSREGVEEMLAAAEFQVQAFILLDMRMGWYAHCAFGMWACR